MNNLNVKIVVFVPEGNADFVRKAFVSLKNKRPKEGLLF